MQHNHNVLGQNVAKFRRQRGWTQEELAAKLKLIGCIITSQILVDIETFRFPPTNAQITFFSEIFRVPIERLINGASVPREVYPLEENMVSDKERMKRIIKSVEDRDVLLRKAGMQVNDRETSNLGEKLRRLKTNRRSGKTP
jgi:transcriptional regulator with XRE-family HTH domain